MPKTYKLVFDDEGKASVKDGWPVVQVTDEDGNSTEETWDVSRQAAALATATNQAAESRLALKPWSGLDPEKVRSELDELKTLRRQKQAGEIGPDADEKIEAAAAKRAAETVAALEGELETARSESQKHADEAAIARTELNGAMVDQALMRYHQENAKLFQDGTAAGWIEMAKKPTPDGYSWHWTGKTHEDRTPIVQLVNGDGHVKRNGTDVVPLGIADHVDTVRRAHPYLFARNNGTGGAPGDGNGHDLPADASPYALVAAGYQSSAANT